MPYKDLPGVIARLRAATGVSARAVEFAALTAGRSGEVRGAVRSEFDLDAALWTIPPERMKAGREHIVPLPARAVDIVRAAMQQSTSDLVFEGGRAGKGISDTAMVKALRAAGAGEATLHGLRSSFRDWAGDHTNYPRDVAEAALAHVLTDKTEAAYQRGTALEKRREMMEDWCRYCASNVKAHKI